MLDALITLSLVGFIGFQLGIRQVRFDIEENLIKSKKYCFSELFLDKFIDKPKVKCYDLVESKSQNLLKDEAVPEE